MLDEPRRGSNVWEAPGREIGKPGENRGKVIAHQNVQPTAAFHDGQNRRNLSRLRKNGLRGLRFCPVSVIL